MYFEPTDRCGTQIGVRLDCGPLATAIGGALASLFGVDPRRQVQRDLTRLKTIIESRAAGEARQPAAGG
jgi:uncharacterized membrane protein